MSNPEVAADSAAAEQPPLRATPAAKQPPILTPAERYSLTALSTIQGALFVWAASVLPWNDWTVFAIVAGVAGGCHLFTALTCLARPHLAPRAWRASSAAAMALLLFVSWQVFTGGSYLVGLYGSLGEGLFAALLAIWGLFVLLTVPTSVWGLVRTRSLLPGLFTRRNSTLIGLGCTVLLALGCGLAWTAPAATELTRPLPEEAFAAVARAAKEAPKRNPKHSTLDGGRNRVECPHSPSATLTLIASHQRGQKLASYCLQGSDMGELLDEVARRVKTWSHSSTVKLDLLTGLAPLRVGPEWLAPFRLRPGLDGVCLDKHCLAPWQLIGRGSFTEHQPLAFLKDLKFGISEPALRQLLGGEPGPLLRITTQSLSIDADGHVTPLRRLRPYELPVTSSHVRAAAKAAQKHILEAQLENGKFRYTLQPFTGKKQTRNFNLARQAGTLYALCELSEPARGADIAIELGLKLLQKYERINKNGALSGLVMRKRARTLKLSNSALPLVAFLACRERIGSQFDATIERLTALVLSLQREDGGFYPGYSLKKEATILGKEPLYAPGQALLALVLLEKRLQSEPESGLAELATVRRAAEAGMKYVARDHWNHSLYSFLFIEENWHCLTARAALSVHRLDEYEEFCLDYVRFKSRLILDEASDVSPEFVGGLGFGNLIPPHNTGAAGFGEALAAAISVKRARIEPVDDERALLKLVFAFLLRQQWTEANCIGCTPLALGSLPEHTHSPLTRIDFVQHAWAALGYESVDFDG